MAEALMIALWGRSVDERTIEYRTDQCDGARNGERTKI